MEQPRGRIFNIVNWAMALVLLASAALQYNDPDPLRWVVLYALAGLTCLAGHRISPPWLAPGLVGLVAVGWAASYTPRVLPDFVFSDLFQTMKAGTPIIEDSREMLGLLIAGVWMVVLVVRSLSDQRP